MPCANPCFGHAAIQAPIQAPNTRPIQASSDYTKYDIRYTLYNIRNTRPGVEQSLLTAGLGSGEVCVGVCVVYICIHALSGCRRGAWPISLRVCVGVRVVYIYARWLIFVSALRRWAMDQPFYQSGPRDQLQYKAIQGQYKAEYKANTKRLEEALFYVL